MASVTAQAAIMSTMPSQPVAYCIYPRRGGQAELTWVSYVYMVYTHLCEDRSP